MKKYTRLMITSMMILSSCAANAANAPTSQFGYHGWPYLQESPCCISQDVMATAQPQIQSTPAPTIQPTAQPTFRPSVPAATPTAQPTKRPQATPSVSTGDYTTISVTVQEQKALNLLNADRAANGLAPLTLDPELSRIARIKSQDMKDNRYFAHTSPTYGNASAMLNHFGYSYKGVGENIAHHSTVEKSQAAFMSSQGHRRNILGSQWEKVGIGVCYDDQGFVYVTQLFVR